MGVDGSIAILRVLTTEKVIKRMAQECPSCDRKHMKTNAPIQNGKLYKARQFLFINSGLMIAKRKSKRESFRYVLNVEKGTGDFDPYYNTNINII